MSQATLLVCSRPRQRLMKDPRGWRLRFLQQNPSRDNTGQLADPLRIPCTTSAKFHPTQDLEGQQIPCRSPAHSVQVFSQHNTWAACRFPAHSLQVLTQHKRWAPCRFPVHFLQVFTKHKAWAACTSPAGLHPTQEWGGHSLHIPFSVSPKTLGGPAGPLQIPCTFPAGFHPTQEWAPSRPVAESAHSLQVFIGFHPTKNLGGQQIPCRFPAHSLPHFTQHKTWAECGR
jgi:hypothetical protein